MYDYYLFDDLAAIINRPKQIQQLEAYEQKLTNISTHKVSEEHFATGRNGQIYIFKNTYENDYLRISEGYSFRRKDKLA